MIRCKKLPANIGDLLPKAINYLEGRQDVEFAYLFGSIGKGKLLPLSDIDIAIHLKGLSLIPEKKMEVLGVLMNLLMTDEIDLVVLNEAPLTLKMKILQGKVVIVDHSPSLRHRFESLVMREYFDFSVMENAILSRRFLSG